MTAPSQPFPVSNAAAASGRGDLILYVDPDPALCREVASHLANLRCRVMTASDGLDAVHMLMAQRSDVEIAIFDSAMPAIDGMPLARALHMVDPSLPLFVLVSGATSALPETARSIYIRGLLRKPASSAALREALTATLTSMRSR